MPLNFSNKIKSLEKALCPKNWHGPCLKESMNKSTLILGLLTLSLLLGSMGCGAGSSAGSTSETSSSVLSSSSNNGVAPGLPPLAWPDPGEASDMLAYLALRLPMHAAYGTHSDHFSMTAENVLYVLRSFQTRLDADKNTTVWMLPSDFQSRLAIDFASIGLPQVQPSDRPSGQQYYCDFRLRLFDSSTGKKVDLAFASFDNLDTATFLNQFPDLVGNDGNRWLETLAATAPETRIYFSCDLLESLTPAIAI